MLGKTHFILSFTITYLICLYLLKYPLLKSLFFSYLTASFAYLPDYDIKINKKIKKMLKHFKKNIIIKILFFPLYLLLKVGDFFTQHRTITHSLFFVFLFLIPIFFINIHIIKLVFICISFGILLHIFQDFFTKTGVPLFYPFSQKKYKIPLISTGKDILKEKILEVGSYIIIIISTIYYLIK